MKLRKGPNVPPPPTPHRPLPLFSVKSIFRGNSIDEREGNTSDSRLRGYAPTEGEEDSCQLVYPREESREDHRIDGNAENPRLI